MTAQLVMVSHGCSHLEGHGLGQEVVPDALLFFRQLG